MSLTERCMKCVECGGDMHPVVINGNISKLQCDNCGSEVVINTVSINEYNTVVDNYYGVNKEKPIKQDMSGTCEFKYDELWDAANTEHTLSQEDWRKWYSDNCGKCKYMCEICMYGEE